MKKTSIGGSALIEGVMMRGPQSIAIAILKGNGDVHVEKKDSMPLSKRYRFLGVPIIRGMVSFFESLVVSMKALMYSAEMVEIEDEQEEPSKVDAFLERVFGDKLEDVVVYFSVILAIIMSVGLFMILPHFVAGLGIFRALPPFVLNLVEGIIRLLLFFAYILLISNMNDIQRVFQFHGAEHKTIHCYEHGEELTVENVKKYTTLHPRCGTSFLLIVMIISILVYSFLGWKSSIIARILPRLLMLPLVAGLSYEVIKYAGRSESKLAHILSIPGLQLQKFTTREPDDAQIRTAIEALKGALPEDRDADVW